MIFDIFLPKKIGSYYILHNRVVGFDISKTHINATQVYFSGDRIALEKCLQEPIDTDMAMPYPERVSQALKRLQTHLDHYDAAHTALSSAIIFFKELTLPFIDREKIALVLDYEIEPMLPFPLADAYVDFIITKQSEEHFQSTILVAAVQKNYVIEHLHYFQDAGIMVDTVTVDMFDLYGLYKLIPSYHHKQGGTVLLDISLHMTRLAYCSNGQLKLIRTLPKGVSHLAKMIAPELSLSNGDALEKLIRFGLEHHDDPVYIQATRKAYQKFFQDIQFTLQSFITQLGSDYAIDTILLLGEGASINDVVKSIEDFFAIPCIVFDPHELVKSNRASLKGIQRIPQSHTISLGTALTGEITEAYNLCAKELRPSSHTRFMKQFFTSIGMIVLIFATLIIHTMRQTSYLEREIASREKEVVRSLQERQLTESKTLVQAINDAQEKITKDEELWFAFSRQSRFSFLKTLQELSVAIDKKALGLTMKKLIITPNTVSMEGEVKGFSELKVLERELRESNLFIAVPPLQELKFNEKLLLKKNGEHL